MEFNVRNVAEEENRSALVRKDHSILGDGIYAPDTLDLTQGIPQPIYCVVLHRPVVDVSSSVVLSVCN